MSDLKYTGCFVKTLNIEIQDTNFGFQKLQGYETRKPNTSYYVYPHTKTVLADETF